MWGKFRILVFQNFPDLLGLGYLFGFLLSACTDFYFFHEAARNINTQSSPQSEVCLQKTKALFFFFKPPEWASLNLFWYSLPLILQMRKWDSRRALASLLPIVMTSRALEGNG